VNDTDGVPDGRFRMTIPVRERGWTHPFVLAVPEAWRSVHEEYARLHGYFWLPCPLCDRSFGGHEWRSINGKESSIPDPFEGPGSGMSIGICPSCTREGRGIETPSRGFLSLSEEETDDQR